MASWRMVQSGWVDRQRGSLIMARQQQLDVTDNPAVRQIAEEVCRTHTRVVLSRAGEPIAEVRPLGHRRGNKRPASESVSAFLATAGAWKGLVDAEELKRQLKESRGDHRPPVELR
jgi:hypothetical protein